MGVSYLERKRSCNLAATVVSDSWRRGGSYSTLLIKWHKWYTTHTLKGNINFRWLGSKYTVYCKYALAITKLQVHIIIDGSELSRSVSLSSWLMDSPLAVAWNRQMLVVNSHVTSLWISPPPPLPQSEDGKKKVHSIQCEWQRLFQQHLFGAVNSHPTALHNNHILTFHWLPSDFCHRLNVG